jgi:hypothetical protein
MASHPLIDQHVRALTAQLPTDTVEELADGLYETFETHLADGGDPDTAAAAAISEFGNTPVIIEAFWRHSARRQLAGRLLLTGPMVGMIWAAVLLTQQAWTWLVPTAGKLVVGFAVLATAVTLVIARHSVRYIAGARTTAAAALTLTTIDGLVIATAVSNATVNGLLAAAIAVSGVRIVMTLSALARAYA